LAIVIGSQIKISYYKFESGLGSSASYRSF
jgi:hypothetical protein